MDWSLLRSAQVTYSTIRIIYSKIKKTTDEKDKVEKKLKDEIDELNVFYLDQMNIKN